MSKSIQVILSFILCSLSFTFAQNTAPKVYFDKSGHITSDIQAYTYRQKISDHLYKEYYVNGGGLFFEGNLKVDNVDQSKTVYIGKCTWYYKNGKKKAIRTFDSEGLEDGTSTYYYENGKNWKEIIYVKGKILNNSIVEYDEDGLESKIFEENFDDNSNDWDLYTSDKNAALLTNGSLQLLSFTTDGTARYINMPLQSQAFALEGVINIEKLKGERAGLLYGFKDWQNYNFFLISEKAFYIGTVYEGISAIKADGMFTGDIKKMQPNTLKVISNGEKNIYSINGIIQYSCETTRNFGSNIGFALSGKSEITVEKLIYKDMDFKSGNAENTNDRGVKGTGSGIIFSTSGYILTNSHVIENAHKITVEVNENGAVKSYNAVLVKRDTDNDLAILKIEDKAYLPINQLQYSFKESGAVDVGAGVFTIGYPFALSGMGKEAKFTDGKISSRTGYNSAINSFQTSIPVQPGSSGGPLFNDKGELIGVVNAKIMAADNVSYAIKLNYIKNLIEILPDNPPFPNNQTLANLPLEQKVKILSNYVVLIKIR